MSVMSVVSGIESESDSGSIMNITVLYFASLADEANCQQETVSVSASTSLADLYQHLSQKHGFSHSQSELRVAINDYFAKWSDQIQDGDSVVFISPVSGG